MPFDVVCTLLRQRLGSDSFTTSEFRDNRRLHVTPSRLVQLMTVLKNEAGFDQLSELTAVDYLNYPNARDRFGVVYGLLNIATGERLFVKTFVNDPNPTVPSVFPL